MGSLGSITEVESRTSVSSRDSLNDQIIIQENQRDASLQVHSLKLNNTTISAAVPATKV